MMSPYCRILYRNVAIIAVKGALSGKSSCLRELEVAVDSALKTPNLLGIVLNLEECTAIGESGFLVIATAIRREMRVGIIFSQEDSQPKRRLGIMKLDVVLNVGFCASQQEAVAFITTE